MKACGERRKHKALARAKESCFFFFYLTLMLLVGYIMRLPTALV